MPKRATINISVPPAVRDYIADRVSEGHYGSVSEYMRELVRQDREERFRDAVDAKLIEALDNGDSREMTPADFARIKAEVRRRAGAKPRKRR